MKICADWKESYKHYSQQSKAVAVSIISSYMALPEKFQDSLSVKYVMALTIVVLILGAIGHVIEQTPKEPS